MSLLKNIFKSKTKRNQERIDTIAATYAPIIMDSKSRLFTKDYVANQCEQIGNAVAELEEARSEYEITTKYLNDMQILEDLPAATKAKIEEIANNILLTQQTKETSVSTTRKISDAQFVDFERMKDDIPSSIRRLKENEDYQSKLKRDLDILEGEKIGWIQEKKHLEQELVWIKKIAILLFVFFGAGIVTLFTIQFLGGEDLSTGFMIAIAAIGIGGIALLIRKQNDEHLIMQSVTNRNFAITLQNKIKLKYVSITNAVDYVKEHYHVKNAYDFRFQWEQYLDAVKEKERIERSDEDLIFFYNQLRRSLTPFELYDSRIWETQVHALIDPKEMVEIRHELLIRRQKIRERIELQYHQLENSRDDFASVLKQKQGFESEFSRIIEMIDRILKHHS